MSYKEAKRYLSEIELSFINTQRCVADKVQITVHLHDGSLHPKSR